MTEKPPTTNLLLWILVPWWFLGLVVYHLILEHQGHLYRALPYLLVVGSVLPFVYLFVRRRRSRDARV